MSADLEYRRRAEDIGLTDILALIWLGRYFIARFVIVFSVLGVLLALSLPNQYRSEGKYRPADATGNVANAGLLSQIGALAGVNLDRGGSEIATLSMETLRSRAFLVDFARRRDAVVPLIAGREWDPRTDSLAIDPEVYSIEKQQWLRAPSPPLTSEPTDDEIYGRFRDILSVERDVESGIITVAVTFYSPTLAGQWLRMLIADLNEQLRRREIALRERSIAYLTDKLEENRLRGVDDELASLLKAEIREHMLSRVRDEYALETVAAPYTPTLKSGPNRALICIAAAFFGGLLGVLALLVTHARKPIVSRPPLVPLRWLFDGPKRMRRVFARARSQP
ncbi:MAG TPA: hypothetical protein VK025_04515 [Steroidobacter sp.]|nr:hypothetical protein [Steroidobacteraceae bacterium]HLS80648.1 hypothetical protein [Steroidobacter sp.]